MCTSYGNLLKREGRGGEGVVGAVRCEVSGHARAEAAAGRKGRGSERRKVGGMADGLKTGDTRNTATQAK